MNCASSRGESGYEWLAQFPKSASGDGARMPVTGLLGNAVGCVADESFFSAKRRLRGERMDPFRGEDHRSFTNPSVDRLTSADCN